MELDLTALLPQLGFSAIFLFLFFQLSKQYIELLNRKDEDLAELNNKLITLVENNTKAMVELKDVISNHVQGKAQKTSD